MKNKFFFILITMLILSTLVIAKDVDLSTFNKQVMSNVDQVLEDNPEVYDTQNIGRTPASIRPVVDPVEENTKKLDQIEEQATGSKDW